MKIWSDDKTGLRSVNMFLSVSCSACPQQHQTPSRHSHAPHTPENAAITLTNVPMFWNINISHGWAIILHKFIWFSNVFQLNNCSRCCYLYYFPAPNDFYNPKVISLPLLCNFISFCFCLFLGTHKTFQRCHLSYWLVLYRCPVDIIIICVL